MPIDQSHAGQARQQAWCPFPTTQLLSWPGGETEPGASESRVGHQAGVWLMGEPLPALEGTGCRAGEPASPCGRSVAGHQGDGGPWEHTVGGKGGSEAEKKGDGETQPLAQPAVGGRPR